MGSRKFDWVLGVVSWGKERSEEDRKALLEDPAGALAGEVWIRSWPWK